MTDKIINHRSSEKIDIKLTLNYFNNKALYFKDGTFYNNSESDIFIFFDWKLLSNQYFNDYTTLTNFIRESNLEEFKGKKLTNVINSFYNSKLDRKLLIKLKEGKILKELSSDEVLNSTDIIYKTIYLNYLFLKDINNELVEIINYFNDEKCISELNQHIRIIFSKEDFVYFAEIDKKSLQYDQKYEKLFSTISFSMHPDYSKEVSQETLEFIQSKMYNYLDLTNEDRVTRDGFKKSITVLLDLSQLITKIHEHFDSIFSENVRLFVSNPYVDNSIIYTLLETPESFHIFHNGIAMVCSNFNFGCNSIKLENVNIVNGAQTIFNISKLVKLGIIDTKFLENKYVLAKIIEVEGPKAKELRVKISQAANTQKAINLQDLKSNDTYLLKYRNLLYKYSIELIIKRGQKAQLKDSLRVDKFSKIIYSALYQKPGYSRNASLDIFFDETKEYFKKVFEYRDSKQINNNLRVLIVYIYLNYIKQEIYFREKISDAHEYAELYYVAYIFGRIILEYKEIKKTLTTNSEKAIVLNLFNESIKNYSEDFINELNSKINTYKRGKSMFNLFKNDEFYNHIYPKSSLVESEINQLIDKKTN